MDIYLDCGTWYMNNYSISGNGDDGYAVSTENNETVYENSSFEACLTWVYNS